MSQEVETGQEAGKDTGGTGASNNAAAEGTNTSANSDVDDAALFMNNTGKADDAAAAQDDNQEAEGKENGAEQADKGNSEGENDKGADDNHGYQAFNMPEGMEVDQEILNEYLPYAKELGLTQEQAQRGVDFAARAVQKTIDGFYAQHDETVQKYAADLKNDKELGGKNYDEAVGYAQKAMKAFATPELNAVLNSTGLGNHPEMVRAFYRVGKAISEDNTLHTGTQSSREKTDEELFFNNSKPK